MRADTWTHGPTKGSTRGPLGSKNTTWLFMQVRKSTGPAVANEKGSKRFANYYCKHNSIFTVADSTWKTSFSHANILGEGGDSEK